MSDEHLPLEVELDADPLVMRLLGPVTAASDVAAAHRRRLATASTGYWAGCAKASLWGGGSSYR